jgi:C-terminal processing protease CtpA/Prc
MKKRLFLPTLFGFGLLVGTLTGCKKEEEALTPTTDPTETQTVNDWIYEQMDLYYYWTTRLPAETSTDKTLSPDAYFETLLNKYNATTNPDGDRFSWIEEDAEVLEAELNGESVTTGMQYRLFRRTNGGSALAGQVLYVLKGSPAERAGFKRGDLFTKVNGQSLTVDTYADLLFGSATTYAFGLGSYDAAGTITDGTTTRTVTATTFQEDPILLDSVYAVGGKKIGYLVYNQFVSGPNGSTVATYDQRIEQIFGEFKSQGVTELVLDLRYNSGGSAVAATNLASLIGKNVSKSQVFYRDEYNADVTEYLKKEYGEDSFNTYFTTEANALGGQLNRVFVLTTGWTASASELIISGLRPYMTVTTIGETTVGKNVGSITLSDDEGKIKWGLQPIVVKVFNSQSKSDYTGGFAPNQPITEPLNLQPLGSTQEAMLATALQTISGGGRSAAVTAVPVSPVNASLTRKALFGRLLVPSDKIERMRSARQAH